ncbi:outer membrane lipoprotein carrier protein LolA, partial [Pseudomonas marginalis]
MSPVGASLLAKVSNGNARALEESGALRFFASK